MEFDLIETPENVELEQRLAGIGTRFMAGLVDISILTLAALVTFLVLLLVEIADALRSLREAVGAEWALAVLTVGMFLLVWGYFALFELYGNGQTPGKRYMKIRVVREGGGAIGFSEVAIRNLLRAVDGFPLYPVAGIVMFFTSKSQRLGDLAAGTVVVTEAPQDYSASADRPKKTEWMPTVSAEALRRTRLTPEELRVLSGYQARRYELSLEARQRLLERLLPPILARLGRPMPALLPDSLEWEVDQLLEGDQRDPDASSEEHNT